MRRALIGLLSLLALPALAGLPPLTGSGSLERKTPLTLPDRPATTLTLAKNVDGTSVDLSWTCDKASVDYQVVRGVMQPYFHGQKTISTITDGSTTYTDTDALTRTSQGMAVLEFYSVYALPSARYPLAPLVYRNEFLERPRDHSQHVKWSTSNSDQFPSTPEALIVGRDLNVTVPGASPVPGTGPWLWDTENFPTPGGANGETFSIAAAYESYANTVDHTGYWGGAYYTVVDGDQTISEADNRQVPTPSADKSGTTVTITWVAPTEDDAGTLAAVRVYRDFLGVGEADSTQVARLSTVATTYDDDITAVTSNYYVFYTLCLEFTDGRLSKHSPSTTAVRR